MFQLIKNYVSTLTKEKTRDFALSKGIDLNDEELDFVYRFIKKNYEALYANPNIDLSKFKDKFSEENYQKIMTFVKVTKEKYARYLN